ncbi:MAG TPA: HAMP domain-containing sensor histidine kinase, partial [Vicinamibacterales bacterium]
DISEQKRLLRALEETSRAKDEFLAMLSHELRTPLNAIMGYARMMAANTIAEERRAHVVRIIERNARTLDRLVSDVLDLSSSVGGKSRLNLRATNLGSIVQAAIDVVRPAADAKRQALALTSPNGLVPVVSDPDRLQQVFWNLLSNAVKFTPPGGRIDVHVARRPDEAEVTVSDTGIGIPPDFLPHVFERFRQGESGVARTFGGLGLGLALVRHFVELHGGRVTASSAGKGLGSSFRVILPLPEAGATPPA